MSSATEAAVQSSTLLLWTIVMYAVLTAKLSIMEYYCYLTDVEELRPEIQVRL